jgi:hypothetical protein
VDVQCLWLVPQQTKDLRTGGRCFDARVFDALAGINGGAISLCLAAGCDASHSLMWNVAHIPVRSCLLHSCAPHSSEDSREASSLHSLVRQHYHTVALECLSEVCSTGYTPYWMLSL